jgi:hypothetical protein
MRRPKVSKIRPLSWKVYVQDEEAARWTRERFAGAGMHTGDIERAAPDLHAPSVSSFVTTSPLENNAHSIRAGSLITRSSRRRAAF